MIRNHYEIGSRITSSSRRRFASRRMERELEAALEAEREREAAEVLEPEDFMSDAEADADALASAGWGSDEDYGVAGFYG